ncbi:hypothetical protein GDO78_016371 [Eleutherodactylus coqui]|uniref:Uncharacterized protein n=1 Tax=Eleutherodactylus coqui TaxID=57060 RepID=A0A8J6EAG8_ELECQ|nr:hypothetical protein GDO78_016371 [Eleutherodactylus coqui]
MEQPRSWQIFAEHGLNLTSSLDSGMEELLGCMQTPALLMQELLSGKLCWSATAVGHVVLAQGPGDGNG